MGASTIPSVAVVRAGSSQSGWPSRSESSASRGLPSLFGSAFSALVRIPSPSSSLSR